MYSTGPTAKQIPQIEANYKEIRREGREEWRGSGRGGSKERKREGGRESTQTKLMKENSPLTFCTTPLSLSYSLISASTFRISEHTCYQYARRKRGKKRRKRAKKRRKRVPSLVMEGRLK